MGRLFWKFFLVFLLAQTTTTIGVGLTFWMRDRAFHKAIDEVVTESPAAFLLKRAEIILRTDGPEGLREHWSDDPPPVFLVDESGRELFGRQLSAQQLGVIQDFAERGGPDNPLARQVKVGVERYMLFAPDFRPGPVGDARLQPGPPPPPSGGPRFPLIPFVAGLIASLIFGALLARYFSHPIRKLRAAVDAAAGGDLRVHPGADMGGRRDELADLGRDFDRMASRLRTLVEHQRRLLHDVSHEMRSPLARQQAALDLARQQPGKLDMCMDRIERELGRMDLLVEELLTLSRMESGGFAEQSEPVEIIDLLEEIVDDARFEVRTSARDLVLSGPTGAVVQGRVELLHRALENVVRNAIKHTLDGTRVEVTVTRGRQGMLVVEVCDRGPGVPEADLDAIFEPFYRSQGQPGGGHGLGLSIARRVIEAHGGSIRARNRPEGGLCVELQLHEETDA